MRHCPLFPEMHIYENISGNWVGGEIVFSGNMIQSATLHINNKGKRKSARMQWTKNETDGRTF